MLKFRELRVSSVSRAGFIVVSMCSLVRQLLFIAFSDEKYLCRTTSSFVFFRKGYPTRTSAMYIVVTYSLYPALSVYVQYAP